MHSNYGWKITWADPDLFDGSEVGIIGPGNIHPDLEEMIRSNLDYNHPDVYHFDMYDDDGERYFSGVLIGEDVEGDEPLHDYGTPYAGCTEIVTNFDGNEVRYA
jgi:hypothetical protein